MRRDPSVIRKRSSAAVVDDVVPELKYGKCRSTVIDDHRIVVERIVVNAQAVGTTEVRIYQEPGIERIVVDNVSVHLDVLRILAAGPVVEADRAMYRIHVHDVVTNMNIGRPEAEVIGFVPVDEYAGALRPGHVVVLNGCVDYAALDDDSGSGAVVGILPGVVDDVAPHGNVPDGAVGIFVARIDRQAVARNVVDDRVQDFNIVYRTRRPPVIAYDDPVLVLAERSSAPHVVDDDVVHALDGAGERSRVEAVIHLDAVGDLAVDIDVEPLEDCREGRVIAVTHDGRGQVGAGLERRACTRAPLVADVRNATGQVDPLVSGHRPCVAAVEVDYVARCKEPGARVRGHARGAFPGRRRRRSVVAVVAGRLIDVVRRRLGDRTAK